MFQARVSQIRHHFSDFLTRYYGVETTDLTVETPPRIEMGDLALTFPFQLARVLRKAPRQIAQEVIDNIGPIAGVARLEAAAPGFINLFLDRAVFFQELLDHFHRTGPAPSGPKIIVEHTNINPNKAAHIGHLRNAVLGDTFVRLMRSQGRQVEVQNYIDNTGVQVADVVVGFHFLRGMSLAEVAAVPDPFDYYCWDLYAEVSDWYTGNEDRAAHRQEVLRAIEHGEDPFFPLAEHIAERIVRAHLATMDRIGVRYDVLPRESEILHLKFWEDAFRQLREREAIFLAEEGPNQGCWVMRLPGENGQPDEDKIIVRSNGTVTYVGKDIAYQLWKFGLLGRTFHYQPFQAYPDGHTVWVTSAEAGPGNEPHFGSGSWVYNVIDVRQSYLQRVVVQGLRSLDFPEQADRSVHFSYEMVALSPRCSEELGIQLSEEDRSRPYVEVSGRKGLGVKADDLLDRLIEKSLVEVTQRQGDLPLERRQEIARQIAVGALRYFMLKYTRNSVIAFDFEEALSFEGETGPYLQYSVVRSNNIFRKLLERGGQWSESDWESLRQALPRSDELAPCLADDGIWSLLRDIARIEDAVRQAVDSLELSGVAKHAFTIAQQFNLFYHSHHILSEENELRKAFYLQVTDTARLALLRVLDLLGLEVPERM
ncbi:MAG: arginine--tRNA ligase [Acidobacteriota bacterium]